MTVTMEIPSPFLLQEKEHFIQKKRKRRKAAAHVDYPGLKKKKKIKHTTSSCLEVWCRRACS